jgi:molecular chaperone GrpE
MLPLHTIYKKMAEKDAKGKVNETPENQSEIDINSDESLSGTSHLNDAIEDESELEKLKTELEEAKDKLLRKVAEFDNFRKRSAKERLELIQTAGKEVITDMLEVMDDWDRAKKQLEKSDDATAIKEGVELIFNKFRNLLQSKGVKPMETIHHEFDPDLHEAITQIPAPSEDLKGKVLDEVMKGYYLNDKIVRHAKVVVGK